MQVKIFLHGHLKERIGADFVCTEAKTAYEAIKSIGIRYKKALRAPLDLGKWRVKLKDYDTKDKLMGRIRHNVLHLYPTFRTAKSAGIGQMIIAVVLIVIGAVADYYFPGNPISPYLYKTGISLMISGALTMMMAPNLNTDSTDTKDKYLGAGEHTTAAGTRIPFGYGKFKIAGHYISYNTSSTLYVAG